MSGDARTQSGGDWAQFEATVLPHLDAAFRLALWLTGDRDDAQDLVQETFSQALQSFHRFTPGTNARAWILTIMRHIRSHHVRRLGRLPQSLDAGDTLDTLPAVESTPQHVSDEEVLDALRQLPPEYQEVVLLADVEDLSYKEIASTVQIPLGTVMSRLHRARRLLRAALASFAASRGVGRRTGPPYEGSAKALS
jgi:RNA polymerase sigma-70 factor, ECF subfamily